jgi:phosphomethylpyrimidine synthase
MKNNGNNSNHNSSLETQLPNSQRVYVEGQANSVRVPFREISLNVTKGVNGQIEANDPVRVYDVSGPWGDTAFTRRSQIRPRKIEE